MDTYYPPKLKHPTDIVDRAKHRLLTNFHMHASKDKLNGFYHKMIDEIMTDMTIITTPDEDAEPPEGMQDILDDVTVLLADVFMKPRKTVEMDMIVAAKQYPVDDVRKVIALRRDNLLN